ncbi:MAG: hypothetical protein R3B07_35725 [Polyangiaceae bacterium]
MTNFLVNQSRSRFGEEFVLAGLVMPGVVTVKVDEQRDLQRDRPKKGGGTRTTDNGFPGEELEISVQLWTEAQRVEFYTRLLPLFSPRRRDKATDPLAVDHWMLRYYGVDAIIVERVSDPGPDSSGNQVITIKAYEWTPAPKTQKGGAGSKAKRQESGVRDEPERNFQTDPADEAEEETDYLDEVDEWIDDW